MMTKAGQKIFAGVLDALDLTRKPDKRVLVCGGRKYANRAKLFEVLDAVPNGIGCIIQGKATGADRLAEAWTTERSIPCEGYEADWNDLETEPLAIRTRPDGSKYNAAAGGIRNQRMLDQGKPDMVVAFPGGDGTADMCRRAGKAGVPIMRVFE